MVNKASSSKLPALVDVDTSVGHKLDEERRLRDREAWRARVERQRERQLLAREIKRQKEEKGKRLSHELGDLIRIF